MVDLTRVLKQVEEKAGALGKELVAEFKKNLEEVFRTVAAAEIKDLFLEVYDELAARESSEFGAAVQGKDPTDLRALRPLFEAQLARELAQVTLKGNELVIRVMNRDDLGFGRARAPQNPPQTVDILAYYIDGIADEFAFITPEQYKVRRKRHGNYGRFGLGFMISREDYVVERWEEVTGLPFNAVRHPISGQAPFHGFDAVAPKIEKRLSHYIQLALAPAAASLGKGGG